MASFINDGGGKYRVQFDGADSKRKTVRFRGPVPIGVAQALERSALFVLNVLGVHTQDPVSGDFSLSAPQSLRVQGGEARGRVRATISGNLFRIIRR